MIRILDIILSLIGICMLFPLLVLIYIIGLIDNGEPLFWQERVGKNKKGFKLVKFRTMKKSTVSVATHLVDQDSVTRLGNVLRKTKLDELPQLWNVVRGEMSLVGPRPGLFNQTELTLNREKLGVYQVCPGITGLAQVNNIDMSTPEKISKMDADMIANLNLTMYLKVIWLTFLGRGQGDCIAKE